MLYPSDPEDLQDFSPYHHRCPSCNWFENAAQETVATSTLQQEDMKHKTDAILFPEGLPLSQNDEANGLICKVSNHFEGFHSINPGYRYKYKRGLLQIQIPQYVLPRLYHQVCLDHLPP